MHILLPGLFLILSAFLIHLGVWKIRIPKYQTKTLLAIFFGTYFLFIIIFELFIPWESRFLFHAPRYFFDYVHILLFFTSFALAYIITYSALEVDSPSLSIIKLISESGAEGLEKEALFAKLSDDVLVIPRIHDLLRDHMAVLDGDKLRLTPKGRWFVGVLTFYRVLLNAKTGG